MLGPLGIHVVPCNEDGRLVVQGIEPGGRVDRDGRLAVGDEIVEINGFPLTNVLFNKAQEIFKEALLHKDLVLQVSMENCFWGKKLRVLPYMTSAENGDKQHRFCGQSGGGGQPIVKFSGCHLWNPS